MFNVETLVLDEVVINFLCYVVEFGATVSHASVGVQRIEVVLRIGLSLFSICNLLKQLRIAIKALLLAKRIP